MTNRYIYLPVHCDELNIEFNIEYVRLSLEDIKRIIHKLSSVSYGKMDRSIFCHIFVDTFDFRSDGDEDNDQDEYWEEITGFGIHYCYLRVFSDGDLQLLGTCDGIDSITFKTEIIDEEYLIKEALKVFTEDEVLLN